MCSPVAVDQSAVAESCRCPCLTTTTTIMRVCGERCRGREKLVKINRTIVGVRACVWRVMLYNKATENSQKMVAGGRGSLY